MARTVNGIAVKRARVYPEGGYWRWSIVDVYGNECVDGGNYRTREEAERGLDDAFDPPANGDAAALRKMLSEAGLSQRGAARELGISERMMRYYCAGDQPIPRVVMLALEHLVSCDGRGRAE